MLHVAAPLGLLALGGLLVPIVIHLVRRPRHVVRLGSLKFLDAQQRRVRSFRWRERLLLALRCLLLAALALMLAGVRWQPAAPAAARWLLRVPGAMLEANARSEWDRLRAEGFEARSLAPGFPRVDDSGVESTREEPVDAWSLLRELDFRLPAGSRAVVFGPLGLAQFRGQRPVVSHVQVTWRGTAGRSLPARPAISDPVRVTIAAATDRAEDARYLRAALDALGSVQVTETSPDWIFQLGEALLAPSVLERIDHGATLIVDAGGNAEPTRVARTFEVGTTTVHVHQRIAIDEGDARLWDSAGEPLLTESPRGKGRQWRFALRFHPAWTDWPHTSAFPTWWREQLLPPVPETGTLSADQAAPIFRAAESGAGPRLEDFGAVDLRLTCWFVAVGLFLLERAVSAAAQRKVTA